MYSLREKCPNTEFFSGPYFPVFSSNIGKYGPGKTSYLDTFHAVIITTYFTNATITITTTAIRKHCYYNYCHYRSNLPVTRSSFKLS